MWPPRTRSLRSQRGRGPTCRRGPSQGNAHLRPVALGSPPLRPLAQVHTPHRMPGGKFGSRDIPQRPGRTFWFWAQTNHRDSRQPCPPLPPIEIQREAGAGWKYPVGGSQSRLPWGHSYADFAFPPVPTGRAQSYPCRNATPRECVADSDASAGPPSAVSHPPAFARAPAACPSSGHPKVAGAAPN